MSASAIATTIGMDELVGSLLTGASLILTTHSLSRMIFLRRSGSKYHLFPIINVTQFANQLCMFLLITAAFNTISFSTALWLNVINNFAYFVTKPTTMYLAYLRCSAVYPKFRKLDWLHGFLIGFRAIELLGIVVINIIQDYMCDGSVAPGTKCANLAIAWTLRDAGAPVFRIYYIICEGIFYVKLFRTLKGMSQGKNVQLMQHRRLQTTLFTVDLALLVFMSIYRIIGIFDKNLPTYVYYELFSSTLTIFNLTEFGLNIRILFNTITDAKTNSESFSSSPSKLEMGSIPPSGSEGRPFPGNTTMASGVSGSQNIASVDFDNKGGSRRHNSASPLTSFAAETGYSSDYSLAQDSAPPSPYYNRIPRGSNNNNNMNANALHDDYDDYVPYSVPGSPSIQKISPTISRATPHTAPILYQDKHIVSPARFQSQAQNGFYEVTDGRSDADVAALVEERRNSRGLSRPNRALVFPERLSRNH